MDKTFFDGVRHMFGGSLQQFQVDAMNAIGRAWATYGDGDIRKLAYLFATAFHESGRFKYVREIWGPTSAQSRYEGRADLGNTVKGDGKRFMGRGFVQITGRRNYADWSRRLGIDLLTRPAMAEDREIAARILVQGCMLGTFTGRSLDDYINDDTCEFIGARRVVNGVDKNKLIAGYAGSFLAALEASPAPKPAAPVPASPEASSARGWLSVLIGVVMGWLKAWLGRK